MYLFVTPGPFKKKKLYFVGLKYIFPIYSPASPRHYIVYWKEKMNTYIHTKHKVTVHLDCSSIEKNEKILLPYTMVRSFRTSVLFSLPQGRTHNIFVYNLYEKKKKKGS